MFSKFSRSKYFSTGTGQTVTPASVIASFVIPAATLVFGAVTVNPAPVTASFNIPAPTFAFGAITVSPAPVTATFNIPLPTLLNVLTVTPASVVATFNIPTPVLVGGTVTVQPAPVTTAFAIPPPILTLGPVTVFPSSVIATFVIPTPTLVIGGTVSPAPVVANFVIPLAVKVGDRFIVGAGGTGVWAGQDNNIATVVSLGPTVWSFRIPRVGESLYRLAMNESLTWDGTGWQAFVGYGKFIVVTSTYTAGLRHFIEADDDIVSGVITITLPLLSTVVNGYTVKKTGSTANVIIVGLGGNTIDDAASQTLSTQYDSFTLVKMSNANWGIT